MRAAGQQSKWDGEPVCCVVHKGKLPVNRQLGCVHATWRTRCLLTCREPFL
jgi:hypothetical protein